jgi:glutaconyl-CoA decarboxylase
MHVQTILAAAAGTPDTADYPYILGLLALAVSIVAIIRVLGISRDLKQSAGTPAPQPSPVPATAPKPSPAPAVPHDGISPEIVAVIAAAVASSTGRAFRIVSIKPMSTSWERAGRQSVLTSHRIR